MGCFLVLFHKVAADSLQIPHFLFESPEDPVPVMARIHRFQIDMERHGYFRIESSLCLDNCRTVCPWGWFVHWWWKIKALIHLLFVKFFADFGVCKAVSLVYSHSSLYELLKDSFLLFLKYFVTEALNDSALVSGRFILELAGAGFLWDTGSFCALLIGATSSRPTLLKFWQVNIMSPIYMPINLTSAPGKVMEKIF